MTSGGRTAGAVSRFRDLPLKQKLTVIIITTTAAALLFSGLGIVTVDSLLFRKNLETELATLTRIIADNSTAALAFDDQNAARETLNALRARPHIAVACLYRADASILVSYVRADTLETCPPAPSQEGVQSTVRSMMVSGPIELKGRRIGTLVIVTDLGQIAGRIRIYSLTVVFVLLLASLVAYSLSSRLRTMFATPILELARVAKSVSKTRDYGIRAQKLSNDEVGDLVAAFNEMLARIQTRDAELRESLTAQEAALVRLGHLNKELQRSNEELARSNEGLERFAFVASHDLQEPLRMITVYSQLLVKQYGDAGGESAAFVDQIVGGTHRMRELLEDVLAYAEVAAKPEIAAAPVDLNAVIESVKQNLKMSIEETGAEIVAASLPVLNANEGHLLSLFQNLISNGIKYRGEQPAKITVSVEETNGDYRFAVSDNGIGIEPEYHAKIFVAFKRLHGKEIPGTGIGLAICQRVVERYGGRIWVESEPGSGSTFRFTFPKSLGEA